MALPWFSGQGTCEYLSRGQKSTTLQTRVGLQPVGAIFSNFLGFLAMGCRLQPSRVFEKQWLSSRLVIGELEAGVGIGHFRTRLQLDFA